MAKKMESRGSGISGSGKGNPLMESRQPVGGGKISRKAEQRGRVSGIGKISRQSDTELDDGEPSNQTSTAQDESGGL